MQRWWLAPLVAVLSLVAAVPATGSAGPDTPVPALDYRSLAPALSQPDYPVTARSAVTVEMADGTQLYVEVVRPHPGAYGNRPWPVILEASPYHGTLADRDGTRIFPDPVDADGNLVGLTGYFAPRGYAVVMVDLRGTGRSTGCLDHLGPNDANDLKEIVEWAAARPWSNGRVGMTGHSYVGSTPAVAAAMRPKGLATIVPSAGLASMYDHQFNRGVPWNLQWAGPQWSYEGLALARHLPPEANDLTFGASPIGAFGDSFGNDTGSFGCGVPQSALSSGPAQVTGQYAGWHAERDWREGAIAADIPVFMIHGVNDNAARIPAAEWFFGHRFGRVGDKVWVGQWDHGSTNGRCGDRDGNRVAHPTCRFAQFQYALHAWFDKHLAQRDVDTGPAVEVFLNGERPVDVTQVVDPEELGARVTTADAWTPPAAWLELFPDATDLTLRTAAPASAASVTFRTIADALIAQAGGSTVEFTSEPFAADTVLVGLPAMQLDASVSTGERVDLVTTLWRVDGAGNREPVSFCGIQPLVRDGVETVTPVVPGEEMTLEPQCFTVAHWIPAGQHLVLEVGTRSPHHASLGSDVQVTVHTGPDRSAYRLPVLTGAALHGDVPLRESAASAIPLGPAQAPVTGTADLGPPGTEAAFEFRSEPGFDNARAHVVATDVEGDIDLWLDRREADGSWTEVASGANGFDIGGPETLDADRLSPGTYRVRILNFAAVPGTVEVHIRFVNQAGDPGR